MTTEAYVTELARAQRSIRRVSSVEQRGAIGDRILELWFSHGLRDPEAIFIAVREFRGRHRALMPGASS